jgi:hypothetical protein
MDDQIDSTENELRAIAKMRGDDLPETSIAWKAADEIAILKNNVAGLASCNRARKAAEEENRLLRGALEDLIIYAKAVAIRAGVRISDPNTGAISHAESILEETTSLPKSG